MIRSVREGKAIAIQGTNRGNTVAMAHCHLLKKPAAAFIIYLAVNEEMRRQHVGSKLFEAALEMSFQALRGEELEPLGALWEVERPELAKNSDDKDFREKRISFYEKLGGRVLDHHYILPPLADHLAMQHLQLMFKNAPGMSDPDHATLDAIIRGIYFQRYADIDGIPKDLLRQLLKE